MVSDRAERDVTLRRQIEDELERIEEDAIHTGKTHFNAASRWHTYHYWIGVPTVLLSAASTFAFFKSNPLIGGGLAAVVTALAALQTFLKPWERAASHKASGDQYLALKNDARVYRKIKLSVTSDDEAVEGLEALSGRRNQLNTGCPPFADRDRKKARADIEKGETVYDVDKRV